MNLNFKLACHHKSFEFELKHSHTHTPTPKKNRSDSNNMHTFLIGILNASFIYLCKTYILTEEMIRVLWHAWFTQNIEAFSVLFGT